MRALLKSRKLIPPTPCAPTARRAAAPLDRRMAFERCDLLAIPTVSPAAPRIDHTTVELPRFRPEPIAGAVPQNRLANLTGTP